MFTEEPVQMSINNRRAIKFYKIHNDTDDTDDTIARKTKVKFKILKEEDDFLPEVLVKK
jgi:hypothetical protein